MPSDGPIAALRDILRHIELATGFLEGLARDDLGRDLRSLYAVVRCLEVISEVSRRLPDPVKARHPEIAWREMAAAGNIYRHAYEDVIPAMVWDTVQHSLPELRRIVLDELSSAPG